MTENQDPNGGGGYTELENLRIISAYYDSSPTLQALMLPSAKAQSPATPKAPPQPADRWVYVVPRLTHDAAHALTYAADVRSDGSAKSWEYNWDDWTRLTSRDGSFYSALHHSPLDGCLYAGVDGSPVVDVYKGPVGGTRVGTTPTRYPVSDPPNHHIVDVVANPRHGRRGPYFYVLFQDSLHACHMGPAAADSPDSDPNFETPEAMYAILAPGMVDGDLDPGKYVFAIPSYSDRGYLYRLNTSPELGDLKRVNLPKGWTPFGRPVIVSAGKTTYWVVNGSGGSSGWGVLYGDADNIYDSHAIEFAGGITPTFPGSLSSGSKAYWLVRDGNGGSAPRGMILDLSRQSPKFAPVELSESTSGLDQALSYGDYSSETIWTR